MIRLIITTLAAARFLRALQHEKVAEPIRYRIDKRLEAMASDPVLPGVFTADELDAQQRREWWTALAHCDLCLGFWMSVAVTLAWRIRPLRSLIEAAAAAALVSAIVEHYPNWNEP